MTDIRGCSALPGQCLSATCNNSRHSAALLANPNIVQEAELRKQCIEEAKKEKFRAERVEFLKGERRKMGMGSIMNIDGSDDGATTSSELAPQMSGGRQCERFDFDSDALKSIDGTEEKTMREPARPSCQLQPPDFTPPSDDYTDLSRFLRISTMAGYNLNDQVSEYRDNHNMAVWNNRKDIDPQLFKMKRDWLSVWGEFNVKEQCWRKAWAEKFGSH